MPTKPKTDKWLDRKLERRTLLKKAAIGGASLAVLYVAPQFSSVTAKRAYATTGVPRISIEFRPDDPQMSSPGFGPHQFPNIELCNVSGHLPTTITNWNFMVNILAGGNCLDSSFGVDGVVIPPAGTFNPLTQTGNDPGAECAGFLVVLHTNSVWDAATAKEIKVEIIATAGTDASTTLTVTITKP
ncbi:MAG: twin-arginine translocation signal domain-containing protein [Chloroflexi bacterium]|nr:twin-arginine translocation signal domain-containing protein [Chloroflexota bacterium]